MWPFPCIAGKLKYGEKRTRFLYTAVSHRRLDVLEWYESTCHPATTIGVYVKDDDYAAWKIGASGLEQRLGEVNGSDDDVHFLFPRVHCCSVGE